MTPERVWASADLLGQPDENALGASDVAEPIHVFVLDYFVDELRAVLPEPGERVGGLLGLLLRGHGVSLGHHRAPAGSRIAGNDPRSTSANGYQDHPLR